MQYDIIINLFGGDTMNEVKCKSMLHEYLNCYKITQKDLAAASGCTEATISRVINGQHAGNIKIWLLIADALGCSVDDLIRLEKG